MPEWQIGDRVQYTTNTGRVLTGTVDRDAKQLAAWNHNAVRVLLDEPLPEGWDYNPKCFYQPELKAIEP